MNHGNVDPGFAAFGPLFIVFAQPTATAQPRQGALEHPASGQHLKSVAVRLPSHHGEQPTPSGPGPRHQPAGVASIRPNHLQPRKLAQQFGQHQLGPIPVLIPVLNIGSVNHHGQEQPPWCPLRCVHYDVSTTMCPLRCGACVQQPVYRRHRPAAPFSRSFHRLAVDP